LLGFILYLAGKLEGCGAVVNIIGDVHKRYGEALWWLWIEYEVHFKSSASSSA
jgi:hypothetical protein